ncbi:MAG TPA: hypothetical protein VGE47_17570 [Burkholderiaceae bacterium]
MKPDVRPSLTADNDYPPLASFRWRLLAEGDSWFSIGTLIPKQASNILKELVFTQSDVIVSCAEPGDTLVHMSERISDPYFAQRLFTPNMASYWEAILISGGGNDMIDAAQLAPTLTDGSPAAPNQRLLRTPAEVAAQPPGMGAERFISEPGWTLLAEHLCACYQELVRLRQLGPSKNRPICTHTYAVAVPRPAGASPSSTEGWLNQAFNTYSIPSDQRVALAALLFERLRALLKSFDQASGSPQALPQVHVFDSAGLTNIVPASFNAEGVSGDWVNEIHLSKAGLRKVGAAMGPWLEGVLARYP